MIINNTFRLFLTRDQTLIELTRACAIKFFRFNIPETQTQSIKELLQLVIRQFLRLVVDSQKKPLIPTGMGTIKQKAGKPRCNL